MKTSNKTVLDIDYTFLKEWTPYAAKYNKVKQAILAHFMNREYLFQSTHDEASKKPFNIYSFAQIENTLGLAYTSTSKYAALFICNGGYLWADKTHYFDCFAITTDGKIIAIAQDENENEIYITLGKL